MLGLLYAGTGQATRRMGSDCALCPAGDLFAHAYRLPEAVERDYDARRCPPEHLQILYD